MKENIMRNEMNDACLRVIKKYLKGEKYNCEDLVPFKVYLSNTEPFNIYITKETEAMLKVECEKPATFKFVNRLKLEKKENFMSRPHSLLEEYIFGSIGVYGFVWVENGKKAYSINKKTLSEKGTNIKKIDIWVRKEPTIDLIKFTSPENLKYGKRIEFYIKSESVEELYQPFTDYSKLIPLMYKSYVTEMMERVRDGKAKKTDIKSRDKFFKEYTISAFETLIAFLFCTDDRCMKEDKTKKETFRFDTETYPAFDKPPLKRPEPPVGGWVTGAQFFMGKREWMPEHKLIIHP